jgi:GNAT superfamily N-acetyltransferase
MSNESLEKKWKEALVGLGLATGSPSFAQEFKFEPNTLHHDLLPIAQLESSGGKNMQHKPSAKGEADTAYGALGLKGSTAHEEYLKSPSLQKLHPHLADFKALLGEMKSNPVFYNNVAASHWNRLKKLTGSPLKAAYAWRYGPAAAAKTPETAIMQDKYVQGYQKLAQPAMQKSEPLIKRGEMTGISALAPGKPTWRNKVVPGMRGGKAYNMDHLLSPTHVARGYSMTVHDGGQKIEVSAHHGGKLVASLDADRASYPAQNDKMHIGSALVQPTHRGQGLGSAMYEALYAHAKHKAGINTVMGGAHSTMAHNVHVKLAQKHGLKYAAQPNVANVNQPEGPYDDKWGEYSFKLSEQDLNKAIADIKPGIKIPHQGSTLTQQPSEPGENPKNAVYDYSHVLSPEHRAQGYKMYVGHEEPPEWMGGGGKHPVVHLMHPSMSNGDGVPVGMIIAHSNGNKIGTYLTDLASEHHGKGLGQSMYEALYAHSKHVLGATHVVGDLHSTMASKVHQKLSDKHGLGYKAIPNPKPPKMNIGAFDNRFQPYSYELKYDGFDKKLEEWSKKR